MQFSTILVIMPTLCVLDRKIVMQKIMIVGGLCINQGLKKEIGNQHRIQ
jgi:hypothetical protein